MRSKKDKRMTQEERDIDILDQMAEAVAYAVSGVKGAVPDAGDYVLAASFVQRVNYMLEHA